MKNRITISIIIASMELIVTPNETGILLINKYANSILISICIAKTIKEFFPQKPNNL